MPNQERNPQIQSFVRSVNRHAEIVRRANSSSGVLKPAYEREALRIEEDLERLISDRAIGVWAVAQYALLLQQIATVEEQNPGESQKAEEQKSAILSQENAVAILWYIRKTTPPDKEPQTGEGNVVYKAPRTRKVPGDRLDSNLQSAKRSRRKPASRKSRPSTQSTDRGELDSHVKELKESGLKNKDIATRLSISNAAVGRSVRRLIDAGEFTPSRGGRERSTSQQKPDKYEHLDPEIIRLRESGMGNHDIAEHLGIKPAQVTSRLQKLIAEGKAKNLRARRRTREELEQFDLQVKTLRLNGLSNKEIADALGVVIFNVVSSVRRLQDKNELALRTPAYTLPSRRVTSEVDSIVEELRAAGCTRQEVSDQLGIPRREVNNIFARLISREKFNARSIRYEDPPPKTSLDPEKKAEREKRKLEKQRAIDMKVKSLLEENKSQSEIAKALNVSVRELNRSITRLVESGETERPEWAMEKATALDSQVKELRFEGKSNNEIAAVLHVSHKAVERSVSRLLRRGEIEKKGKVQPTQDPLPSVKSQPSVKEAKERKPVTIPEKPTDRATMYTRVWEILELFDGQRVSTAQIETRYTRMHHEALPDEVVMQIPLLANEYRRRHPFSPGT